VLQIKDVYGNRYWKDIEFGIKEGAFGKIKYVFDMESDEKIRLISKKINNEK
jgi:hypothetical protein